MVSSSPALALRPQLREAWGGGKQLELVSWTISQPCSQGSKKWMVRKAQVWKDVTFWMLLLGIWMCGCGTPSQERWFSLTSFPSWKPLASGAQKKRETWVYTAPLGFSLKLRREAREKNRNQSVGSVFTNCELNTNNRFLLWGGILGLLGDHRGCSWEGRQAGAWVPETTSFLRPPHPSQRCQLVISFSSPSPWEVALILLFCRWGNLNIKLLSDLPTGRSCAPWPPGSATPGLFLCDADNIPSLAIISFFLP